MAQTLNDPVDGAELKKIILERISRALDKDSTLTNDVAYAGFWIKYNITVQYYRSKTLPTLIWGDVEEKVDGEVEQDPAVELVDSYVTDIPNQAREDHSLPVPVMVQTPSGAQRRKVHIEKKPTGIKNF